MSNTDNSGMIDLFATHRAAQEAIARASSTDTPSAPAPAVAFVTRGVSDAGVFAPTGRRRPPAKWIAAGVGALALLGIGIAAISGGREPEKTVAAAMPATPPAPEPPPAEPTLAAPTPAPVADAKPVTKETETPAPKKRSGAKRKPAHFASPKMIKVKSSGT